MRWSKENLQQAVSKAECISDVCRILGITSTASNYKTFHRYCQQYEINISHFVTTTTRHKRANQAKRKLTNDDIFCEGSTYAQAPLRKRVLRDRLIEHKCEGCGITDKWNGQPITLQLDHKNGVNNDHRLHNLRWLCPNCHSQTSTYVGKNRLKNNLQRSIKFDLQPKLSSHTDR